MKLYLDKVNLKLAEMFSPSLEEKKRNKLKKPKNVKPLSQTHRKTICLILIKKNIRNGCLNVV